MLYIFLMLFTGTAAFENENCDYVVMLQKGQIKQLPRYPFKEASVSCRWNVIADSDRRIIFSCTSYERPDLSKLQKNPCNGKFKVSVEGTEDWNYCREKTFTRFGESNRMLITYNEKRENAFDTDLKSLCYLYAELKHDIVDPNIAVTAQIGYESCDYNIELEKNDVVRLDNPKHMEEEPGWTGCRWTVTAPLDSKVSLACPFTDKPPEPLTIQMVPCTGVFSVKFQDQTKTYNCSERSFSITSSNNEMVIMYISPMSKRYEDYQCYLYLEPQSYEPGLTTSPYKKCDKFIELWYHDLRSLKSPDWPYPQKKLTGCRWTLVSPPDTRIALNCLFPKQPREIENTNPKDLPCHGEITVLLSGGKETLHCADRGFHIFSTDHQMIITYSSVNPNNEPGIPFQCYVSTEQKLHDCENCTGIDAFNFKGCDEDIDINGIGTIKELASPDYPNPIGPGSICRWTIHYPKNSLVYLDCEFPNHTEENADCKGYFTVYPTGKFEDETVHCYDIPFSVFSTGNDSKMIVTYSGQKRNDPFKCYVTTYHEKCEKYVQLDLSMGDSDFDVITAPSWPTEITPWPYCTWHYEVPPKYRLNLKCENVDERLDCERRLEISFSGERNLEGSSLKCLEENLDEMSLENKMSLQFNDVANGIKANQSIGCRMYLNRKPLCNCGRSLTNLAAENQRIAGGENALPNEFPMMAALIKYKSDKHDLFCGATIISERYALTAARCLTEAIEYSYDVGLLVGTQDRRGESNGSYIYIVDKMTPHPDFSDRPHRNDIGIARVSESIIFSVQVEPACLPYHDSEFRFEKEKVITLGWGQHELSDSSYLLKMRAYVEEDFNCQYTQGNLDPAQHICIRHSAENVCTADSGGPILWLDPRNNHLKVIGILFSIPACQGQYHTKATEVGYFLEWIDDNTPGVHFCKTE